MGELGKMGLPDGTSAQYIVEVHAGDLTPHFVYVSSRRGAVGLARMGRTEGVFEFSPLNAGELVQVPADRYSGVRGGSVIIHPYVQGVSMHQRVAESQECTRQGCDYSETIPRV